MLGWIVLGVGVLNAALLPVCHADFYPEDSETACVALTAVYVVGAAIVGATSLSIGYSRRARYRDWKAQHKTARLLEHLQLGAGKDSALIGLRTTF